MVFGRKKGEDAQDPVEATPVTADGAEPGASGAGIERVAAGLGSIEELLSDTRAQVTGLLARHTAESARSIDAKLTAIATRLDQVAAKLDGGAVPPPAASAQPPSAPAVAPTPPAAPAIDPAPLIEKLQTGLGEKFDGVTGAVGQATQQLQGNLGQVYQHLDGRLQEILAILQPPATPEAEQPASLGDDVDWQRALIGHELTQMPGIEAYRRHLLEGLMANDDGARTFLGQLLVFRSALTDQMPQLLKPLGEAFYRWLPKDSHRQNPMEDAVVYWLNQTLAEAGIGNTVEVCAPGERFDTQRHQASNRAGGVEIQVVRGWMVLRDNGGVYTRALVDVV